MGCGAEVELEMRKVAQGRSRRCNNLFALSRKSEREIKRRVFSTGSGQGRAVHKWGGGEI